MQFVSSRIEKQPRNVSAAELLSLYVAAPQEEISLDEFELFALDRLSLLRGIETVKTRTSDPAELKNNLKKLEQAYMPLKSRDNSTDSGDLNAGQRKDQISHFILRLAFCRTEDLRRWFIAQEIALFKYRLEALSDRQRGDFMAHNGMDYELLDVESKIAMQGKLDAAEASSASSSSSGDAAQLAINTSFYKVPFHEALPLVAGRAVYLEGGFAYVPLSKLLNVIIVRFRMNLSKSLASATHFFEYAAADTRIGALLKNMNKQYTGKDFNKAGAGLDKLTPESVEAAAEASMPLCMKNLHAHLKHEHKLKHWGRLQYGLFLKAAGMELDDAMRFWEGMFTKIMSHDDFSKKYAYNVRHMYGKEGARKNYTPYSCMKIIMGAPPEPGAFHGCPYKHMPESQLSSLLTSMKISSNPADVTEIVSLAKGGMAGGGNHFGLACQKHFDLTHPGHATMGVQNSENVAVHPNQWFQASVQYHKAKSPEGATAAVTGAASSSSSSAVAVGGSSSTMEGADESL